MGLFLTTATTLGSLRIGSETVAKLHDNSNDSVISTVIAII